ncbi:hypothetical protein HK100_011264 [Physocladia obscura]|uniref:Uncharacterized protein n=1 Tax=Physocladia obscura TaxID=109957 RepID=A0AAD5T3D2_9FUNG|nr:hypothetical protein HK100_011264 [Physocladia obscura]
MTKTEIGLGTTAELPGQLLPADSESVPVAGSHHRVRESSSVSELNQQHINLKPDSQYFETNDENHADAQQSAQTQVQPDDHEQIDNGRIRNRVWRTVRAWLGSKNPIVFQYSQFRILSFQEKLSPFLSRIIPRGYPMHRRAILLIVYNVVLLIAVGLFAKYSSYSAYVNGYSYVQSIDCASVFMDETGCGDINAVDCEPFSQILAARCPAGCLSQLAWTPIYVAPSAVQYSPFVVGSDNLYRGDSFICSAAIHAGVLDNAQGGCIIAALNPSAGETYSSSTANSISSTSFNATYPASLSFIPAPETTHCTDLGFDAEGFFLPFILLTPILNVSRKFMFWSVMFWIYLYWTFVSPDTGKDNSSVQSSLANFLPAFAVLYVLYATVVRYGLPSPTVYPLETFLWIGMVWLGFHIDMLSNYFGGLSTFTFSSTMFSNPSTAPILIALIVCISLLILLFVYMHFKQDTLFPYLVGYLILAIIYFELPKFVGLSIHLHHYLLGLTLLPLTRVNSRIAMICQVVPGVLKYGFASPFDTSLQASAIYTKGTTQTVWNLTHSFVTNGTLEWVYPFNSTLNLTDLTSSALIKIFGSQENIANAMAINEYSLVVNDVQVYRGKHARFSFADVVNVTSASNGDEIVAPFQSWATTTDTMYVRVAPVSFGSIQGYGDVVGIKFRTGDISKQVKTPVAVSIAPIILLVAHTQAKYQQAQQTQCHAVSFWCKTFDQEERHRQRKQATGTGHDAFISYRVVSEATFARLLHSNLQEKGLDVFLDVRCLHDGEDWEVGFNEGLKDCKTVLYLLSRASLEIMKAKADKGEEDNVLKEIKLGLERNLSDGVRLVPILLSSYTPSGDLEEFKFSAAYYTELPSTVKPILDQLFKMNGFDAHPKKSEDVVDRLIQGNVLAPPQLQPQFSQSQVVVKPNIRPQWEASAAKETEVDLQSQKPIFWRLLTTASLPQDAISIAGWDHIYLARFLVQDEKVCAGACHKNAAPFGILNGGIVGSSGKYQVLCGDKSSLKWKGMSDGFGFGGFDPATMFVALNDGKVAWGFGRTYVEVPNQSNPDLPQLRKPAFGLFDPFNIAVLTYAFEGGIYQTNSYEIAIYRARSPEEINKKGVFSKWFK